MNSIESKIYRRICRTLGKYSPLWGKIDKSYFRKLERPLKLSDLGVKYEEVGKSCLNILFLGLSISIILIILHHIIEALLAFSILCLLIYFLVEYPGRRARLMRIEELRNYPEMLIYLSSYLKVNPNLERAVDFTTQNIRGKLSKRLRSILRRSLLEGNLKERLVNLVRELDEGLSKEFYYLILSLSESVEERRKEILDRGLNLALDNLLRRFKEFSHSLYLPTLLIFSLGTVLPLILISFFPIVLIFFRVELNHAYFFILPFLSLIGVWVCFNRLIERRPEVSSSSIEIPETQEVNHSYLFLIFFSISFPSAIPFLNFFGTGNLGNGWLFLFLPTSIVATISLGFWLKSRGRVKKLIENERMEEEIIGFNYSIASMIRERKSIEEALSFWLKNCKESQLSKLVSKLLRRIRKLGLSLEEGIRDKKYGILSEIFSEKVRTSFRILSMEWKNSEVLADILFTITSYFEELKRIEEEGKLMLRQTISVMRLTAVLFAPLTCGLVIGMYHLLQTTFLRMVSTQVPLFLISMNPFSVGVEILQFILGIYLIILSLLLLKISTFLEFGPNRLKFESRICKLLPISFSIFMITSILSVLILG